MCLAQGPQRSDTGETRTPRSRVKHSTIEPLRSQKEEYFSIQKVNEMDQWRIQDFWNGVSYL